eukprot:m.121926 g.121926  ORF g.121926 m.121926 type:complete len:419 (+) comp12932_c2_seq1:69-1325(+)
MDELLPLLDDDEEEQQTFQQASQKPFPLTAAQLTPVETPTFRGAIPEIDVDENQKKKKEPPPDPPLSLFDRIEGYTHTTLKPHLIPPPVEPQPKRGARTKVETNNVGRVEQLSEGEALDALSKEVNKHFCWGKKPLRNLLFTRIGANHAFDYSLKTYGEARFVKWTYKPHVGDVYTRTGSAPSAWDVASPPPRNGFKDDEFSVEVPHTSSTKTCYHCNRFGHVRCFRCMGRGKLKCGQCRGLKQRKHKDRNGRDQIETCTRCAGIGRRRCPECVGHGQTTCDVCVGSGQLRVVIMLTIKRTSLEEHHVSDATLPGQTIQAADGIEVYKERGNRLAPINTFANESVNTHSHHAIQAHASKIRGKARMLYQQQLVRAVPVHECDYAHDSRAYRFYVVGTDHNVEVDDYPQKSCMGLCAIL